MPYSFQPTSPPSSSVRGLDFGALPKAEFGDTKGLSSILEKQRKIQEDSYKESKSLLDEIWSKENLGSIEDLDYLVGNDPKAKEWLSERTKYYSDAIREISSNPNRPGFFQDLLTIKAQLQEDLNSPSGMLYPFKQSAKNLKEYRERSNKEDYQKSLKEDPTFDLENRFKMSNFNGVLNWDNEGKYKMNLLRFDETSPNLVWSDIAERIIKSTKERDLSSDYWDTELTKSKSEWLDLFGNDKQALEEFNKTHKDKKDDEPITLNNTFSSYLKYYPKVEGRSPEDLTNALFADNAGSEHFRRFLLSKQLEIQKEKGKDYKLSEKDLKGIQEEYFDRYLKALVGSKTAGQSKIQDNPNTENKEEYLANYHKRVTEHIAQQHLNAKWYGISLQQQGLELRRQNQDLAERKFEFQQDQGNNSKKNNGVVGLSSTTSSKFKDTSIFDGAVNRDESGNVITDGVKRNNKKLLEFVEKSDNLTRLKDPFLASLNTSLVVKRQQRIKELEQLKQKSLRIAPKISDKSLFNETHQKELELLKNQSGKSGFDYLKFMVSGSSYKDKYGNTKTITTPDYLSDIFKTGPANPLNKFVSDNIPVPTLSTSNTYYLNTKDVKEKEYAFKDIGNGYSIDFENSVVPNTSEFKLKQVKEYLINADNSSNQSARKFFALNPKLRVEGDNVVLEGLVDNESFKIVLRSNNDQISNNVKNRYKNILEKGIENNQNTTDARNLAFINSLQTVIENSIKQQEQLNNRKQAESLKSVLNIDNNKVNTYIEFQNGHSLKITKESTEPYGIITIEASGYIDEDDNFRLIRELGNKYIYQTTSKFRVLKLIKELGGVNDRNAFLKLR